MNCDRYRAFWQDVISESEFETHLRTCNVCRDAVALDEHIEREARMLPAPTSAPGLWNEIEAQLRTESASGRSGSRTAGQIIEGLFDPRRYIAFKVAAVLLLTVGITYFAIFRPESDGPQPRNLLTYEALVRVEAVEREYEAAILQLERVAEPILAKADTELLLLYRQRLETIDAQIQRCQDALALDLGNTHIRRYLLAAFQDKQEALTELVALTQG